ncbi:hypothetical protein HDU96_001108 [Phlyctochytrium bullatum]|nr:hypothetical protein HDU96_001108 [Phlyctochytrium bullatum]
MASRKTTTIVGPPPPGFEFPQPSATAPLLPPQHPQQQLPPPPPFGGPHYSPTQTVFVRAVSVNEVPPRQRNPVASCCWNLTRGCGYFALFWVACVFFLVLFWAVLPWTGTIMTFVLPGDIKHLTFDTRFLDAVTFTPTTLPTPHDLHLLKEAPTHSDPIAFPAITGDFSFIRHVSDATPATFTLPGDSQQLGALEAWVFPFAQSPDAQMKLTYEVPEEVCRGEVGVAAFVVGGVNVLAIPRVFEFVSTNITQDYGCNGTLTLTPKTTGYHLFGLLAVPGTRRRPNPLTPGTFTLTVRTPLPVIPTTPPVCSTSEGVCMIPLPRDTRTAHLLAVDSKRSPAILPASSLLRGAPTAPSSVAGAYETHGQWIVYAPLRVVRWIAVVGLFVFSVTTCCCGVSPGWVVAKLRGREEGRGGGCGCGGGRGFDGVVAVNGVVLPVGRYNPLRWVRVVREWVGRGRQGGYEAVPGEPPAYEEGPQEEEELGRV